MGREIKRVPLDFIFPLGESWADAQYAAHLAKHHPTGGDCECDNATSGPPKGEGWQLWQTVSDGPISPVFATPEELITFMSTPDPKRSGPFPRAQGWPRDVAEAFVRGSGWAPTLAYAYGQLTDGVTFIGTSEKKAGGT